MSQLRPFLRMSRHGAVLRPVHAQMCDPQEDEPMNAVLNQATPAATAVIDEDRLHELMGRVLVDFGAAYLAP
jgi:hypothetical protein